MAQVVNGNRGGKILLHLGHRYRRNQTRATGIYWKCDVTDCPSKILTDVFNINAPNPAINIRNVTPHNGHASADATNERSRVLDRMREKIRRDPTQPVKAIYNRVVFQTGQQNQYIPAYNSVRSILTGEGAVHVPPIPCNIAQVNIQGLWARTFANERYLLHQNNNTGVLVFATHADIIHLANARHHGLRRRDVQNCAEAL